jgi:hypothetical protein
MRVVLKRGKFVSKLLASLLMALAATVSVYAIASVVTSLVALPAAEPDARIEVDEFVAAQKRVAAVHRRAEAGRGDNFMPDVVPDVALYRAHLQLPDAQLDCFAPDETSAVRKRRAPRKNWPQVAVK